VYAGKWIQEVVRNAQFVLFPPLHRAENMQEHDHVGEIGLVIAHEQHILTWKIFYILSPLYLNFIEDCEAGIGEDAYDKIDNRSDDPYLL
jgi:hypothetical protein